ncbi:MAG: NUDIX hydrolase, partial [Planctomycetota bacterium]
MSSPSNQDSGPAPWPLVSSRSGPNLMLFRARWDVMTNPRNQQDFDRLVLETRDWVNVVARTPEGDFILVRQFRFGTREITTEIPGGVIDPGEEHAETAPRELREETGYTSSKWTYLGSVRPNPAFHDNRCHHWLAE